MSSMFYLQFSTFFDNALIHEDYQQTLYIPYS